jgi:hypothetical protein
MSPSFPSKTTVEKFNYKWAIHYHNQRLKTWMEQHADQYETTSRSEFCPCDVSMYKQKIFFKFAWISLGSSSNQVLYFLKTVIKSFVLLGV